MENNLTPAQKRKLSILKKREKKIQKQIAYITKHGESKVKETVKKRQNTLYNKYYANNPLPNFIEDDTKPIKKSHEERANNHKYKTENKNESSNPIFKKLCIGFVKLR